MALRARTLEHGLALDLELVEHRIGIWQRRGAGIDGLGERAHTMVREQHALKGRQVVEALLEAARF